MYNYIYLSENLKLSKVSLVVNNISFSLCFLLEFPDILLLLLFDIFVKNSSFLNKQLINVEDKKLMSKVETSKKKTTKISKL